MKSPSRQKLADKVSNRIQELKRTESESEKRTGRETINLLVGLEKPDALAEKPVAEKEIILFLKEGVNPANSNFTKYPNNMHPMMVDKLRDMSEEVLYIYLWRESWGWGRNYCRTSYRKIFENTLLGSTKTAQRAIESLLLKKCIIKNLLASTQLDITRQGTLYRVLTPEEIINGKTEEGAELETISVEGVVMVSIDTKSTDRNVYRHHDYSNMDNKSMDIVTIEAATPDDDKEKSNSGNNVYGNNDHPLKEEDNLKDSLSLDLIELFYTGIGQKRISKVKREKGDSVLQELQKEGFSPEDIQFAIEWTLKPGNTKEKVHDFSILSHTIGQALSAREAGQQAAESAQKEAARVRATEEEERRLKGNIEALRAKLSEVELADLRDRAEKEIAQTEGIKKEFINEPLIVAKENEILRRDANNS